MLGLCSHGSPFLFPLPGFRGYGESVALAVLAACELGVSVQEISDRLPQYRPSALEADASRPRATISWIVTMPIHPR